MEFFSSINAFYVFVGSLLLGAMGGLFGVFAVLRKQGFLGDALAQAALPGIVIAFLIVQVKNLPVLLFGGLMAAFLGAFAINFLVKNSKIKMDCAMASVLSVFFGFGVLLLTYIQKLPFASQSGLDSFLLGRAAALLKPDIIWISFGLFLVFSLIFIFWKELKLFIFDPEYARVLGFNARVLEFLFLGLFVVSIVLTLETVGVVLTAALFITPASAALLWSGRLLFVVILSAFFGMFSGVSGAVLSSQVVNMPTGPVIVSVAFFIFLFSLFFAPKRGLFLKGIRYFRYSVKVQTENVLGQFYRDFEVGMDSWSVRDFRNYGYKMWLFYLLKFKGLLELRKGYIFFTEKGFVLAKSVIEKHRLWETYLVNELKIAPDHVHRDAEYMEHILTDEMTLKLKKLLKNPKKDPHGKPIP